MKRFIPFFVILIFSMSCKHKVSSEKEYYGWINNDKHGLCDSKTVGDLKLKVKYFPAELLAYKELKGRTFTAKEKDSLVDLYSKSLTFLLTISPDESKGAAGDIMYRGISNMKEYKERVSLLNFGMDNMVSLSADGKEFHPVLAVMENTYSTSESRSFYLVFNEDQKKGELMKAGQFDLVFSDEVFDTGINHFLFKKENFDKVPKIDFWN